MTFHLGRKEFIENLSSDVLDVENAVHRRAPHAIADTDSLRSWKYPGISYLDVDTRNLVSCFRFNVRSLDESVKAHLILTELLIDRLVAFLFVCALMMEKQIVADDPRKTNHFGRKFSERNAIACVASYFGRVYASFLTAWGVGVPPATATAEMATQTSADFNPHAPCDDCSWKSQWLQKISDITKASLNSQILDLKLATTSDELRKTYDHAMAENKNVTQALKTMEKDVAVSSSENSKKTSQLRALQKLIETIAADISSASTQSAALDEALRELDTGSKQLQVDTALRVQENQGQQADLARIDETCATLVDQLKACESKLRARRRVYELSALAVREKNVILAEDVGRMTEKIQEIEKTYDPQWQEKLRDAEEKVNSLGELWSDSDGLTQFNESRIVELTAQYSQRSLQKQKLQNQLELLRASAIESR